MKIKSQSGSILLSTLSFIILLAVAAASILELTMNSYKLTMRNEMRAQARSVAESELESVYYQWVGMVMAAVPAAQTPAALGTISDTNMNPVTDRSPFLAQHRAEGWVVRRSVNYNPTYDFFDGIIPNTTKQGKVTYITVLVEVLPNATSFFRNELSVRVGRRFASSNTSIFQYGLFYQGDLEMAPGNPTVIDGDVAANGSIYMAAQGALGSLTLNKSVKYLQGNYFNQDSLGNTVLRKPNTFPTGTLHAPTFLTSQASQVSTLSEPENLVGGADAAELMARRPDLFPVENDVYRAAILPPPDQTDEYPTANALLGDDPTIGVQRMYNRAGLRITVNTDNTVTFTKGDGTDITAAMTAAGVVTGTVNNAMYDQREQKDVMTTTIDMAALMTAVQANYPTGASDFNGALYVNLKGNNTTTPRAVKLINGSNVYGRKQNGTSVATNGGIYVQGDYNTANTPLADGKHNPAMLMADQITALSPAWDDTNAAANITYRIANSDMTINAGLLTGSKTADILHPSGGAQNLLRYLENWDGHAVTINGALGRLFESKIFTGYFNAAKDTPHDGSVNNVYFPPATRQFQFDRDLLTDPPSGSPITTAFSRGSFFVW